MNVCWNIWLFLGFLVTISGSHLHVVDELRRADVAHLVGPSTAQKCFYIDVFSYV